MVCCTAGGVCCFLLTYNHLLVPKVQQQTFEGQNNNLLTTFMYIIGSSIYIAFVVH